MTSSTDTCGEKCEDEKEVISDKVLVLEMLLNYGYSFHARGTLRRTNLPWIRREKHTHVWDWFGYNIECFRRKVR